MRVIIFIFIIIFINSHILLPQTQEVRNSLNLIAQGKIDDVKITLPDLLAEYPDDPGVQLLHGIVIEDGYKAIQKYMDIIVNYPTSEWADDAYWRIVQFYAIIGDTSQAKMYLENYRKNYPASEFLVAATDAVKAALFIARNDNKIKNYTEVKINTHTDIKKTKNIEENEYIEDDSSPEATEEEIIELQDNQKPKEIKEKYGLQVGVYSTYDAAKGEVERFKAMRMLADIKQKKIGDETMYAVIIGDYSSKESAENAKLIVQQQCKCIPIIFKK